MYKENELFSSIIVYSFIFLVSSGVVIVLIEISYGNFVVDFFGVGDNGDLDFDVSFVGLGGDVVVVVKWVESDLSLVGVVYIEGDVFVNSESFWFGDFNINVGGEDVLCCFYVDGGGDVEGLVFGDFLFVVNVVV